MGKGAEAAADERIRDSARDTLVLKAVVAVLAVAFIAAPVAYGAYEIYALTAPLIDVWRWPVIFILGCAFVLLAWWVVTSIHRKFPYS